MKVNLLTNLDMINKLIMKPKIWDLTDLFPQREKRKEEVLFIVYHHEGCQNSQGMMQVHEHHTVVKNWRSIAYHYYITKEGKIYNPLDTATINASEEGHNSESISICLQGNFDIDLLEGKQEIQFIKLLAYLKTKYPDADIMPHRELNATGCPGTHINKRQIWLQTINPHFINFIKPKTDEK